MSTESHSFHYLPPRFLRTRDAADFLGLSPRTMEKHRSYGTGPMFCKLGGRVVYAIDDLEAWAELGRISSTTDPRGGTPPAKRQNLRPQTYTDRYKR